MSAGILEIREFYVSSFLLWDDAHTVLIDTGFHQGGRRIPKALRSIGRTPEDITHILLTHGHLDHTLNLHALQKASGAEVIAHPAEFAHVAGEYPYKGPACVCGVLETIGRFGLRYRPFVPDSAIQPGDVLPLCGGIEAVHLPGHTVGHTGYHHRPTGTLFIGDLVAFRRRYTRTSPFFLNTCPGHFPVSIRKVLELDPARIYASHTIPLPPKVQRERFQRFAEKFLESGTV